MKLSVFATLLIVSGAAHAGFFDSITGIDPPPVELSQEIQKLFSVSDCEVEFNNTLLKCVLSSKVQKPMCVIVRSSTYDADGIKLDGYDKPMRFDAGGKIREGIASAAEMEDAAKVKLAFNRFCGT